MGGENRTPSSLVQFTTSIGRLVTHIIQNTHDFQPGENSKTASDRRGYQT